jgi:hypothetical protein
VVLILVTRGVFFKVRRSVGRGEGGRVPWLDFEWFHHQWNVTYHMWHAGCYYVC